MAERKFDYEAVSQNYANMNNIIGDAGDASSITGILNNIDKEYHNLVDVEDEAVFGDLAKQLLLDWENTSSNFPDFIDNFQKWTALISKSSGEYSKFEEDVKGFKGINPLGTTSAGRTINYVDGSTYRDFSRANVAQYTKDLSNLATLKEITGVQYVSTDSESILKKHKIITGIVGVADILGLAWSAMAAAGLAGAAAPAATSTVAPSTGPLIEGATPLALEGSSTGVGMTEFIDQMALTQGVPDAYFAEFEAIQNAGATFVSGDAATQTMTFFDSAGKAIAEFTRNGIQWL